jgi:regulator of protease activity HflC (stomatin/prohibitin superfamily)
MRKAKNIVITVLVLIAIIITCAASCTRIDAGHEGIKVKQYGTNKGVQDITLVTGRVWYNPFTETIYEFPTFVQTMDYEPFTVNAKDGSVFEVDPTISYNVISGRSPHIFVKYRKSIDEITATTLYNYVKDAYRIQFNNYTTEQLISNRQQFENAVQNSLNEQFKIDGFELQQLTSGLKYPESIVQAIDAKNRAVQAAMQAQNELVRDSIEAKRKIIQAEAEKRANELRQSSLTPLLIQQQFIEKWDGHTPLYGNSPVMFKNVN